MTNKPWAIVVAGICLFIAAVAMAHFGVVFTEIEGRLNLVELAGVLATIYVIYIAAELQYTISDRTSNDKGEKDLILNLCNQCNKELHKCRKVFAKLTEKTKPKQTDLQPLLLGLRSLSNSLNRLEKCLKLSRLSFPNNNLEGLSSLYIDYKKSTTDFRLNQQILGNAASEADKAYEKFADALMHVWFEINRAQVASIRRAGRRE